jgi:hypothetical protein
MFRIRIHLKKIWIYMFSAQRESGSEPEKLFKNYKIMENLSFAINLYP